MQTSTVSHFVKKLRRQFFILLCVWVSTKTLRHSEENQTLWQRYHFASKFRYGRNLEISIVTTPFYDAKLRLKEIRYLS